VIKRALIAVHRWLGVALALNFFVWFASGLAMMYWDFPSVSPADRLARAPALEGPAVRVSLAEALNAAGVELADEVRLETFDGRPVYRIRAGRTVRVVYADSAGLRTAISRDQLDRIASHWAARDGNRATVRGLDDVDQWTVQLPLQRLKPVWQYSWPEGEQVYVSQASGEVIQFTTRASRLGAYVGAIPHWLYVTPLRRNGPTWSRIVIGLSAVATVVAALGLTIGVWVYSPSRRYRYASRPARIPYRGWKRWHAVLGLIVGLSALTWAFSGMLSMDPFPLPGDPPHTEDLEQALRGSIEASPFQALSPSEALASLGTARARQLEVVRTDNESFYVATLASGRTRIISLSGATREALDIQQVAKLAATAVEPDRISATQLIDQYDRYYLDRHGVRPLPVVLVRLSDRDASRFYIDPGTARLVGTYSNRNWITRWLYHGLHSLDFPWLYRYRPMWDIVVGAFMIAGTALCFTSLVLAWQVLGRFVATKT